MISALLFMVAALVALIILGTASPGAKLGIKCVAYLNTANYASPTWSAITCISDWKVSPKWKEADASTRASQMELALKTMLGLEVSGKMRASDSGDTNYTTISGALITNGTIDVMVLNGTNVENGAWGFRADFQVFDASEDQGLNSVVFDEILLKPSVSLNTNYNTVLVTSGTAAFTAI